MAGGVQIEFEEPTFSTCGCCGETSTHLVRYVSRDKCAFAVYFADLSEGHDFVSVLASFGAWGEDAPPSSRLALTFRIWVTDDSYQVGFVDGSDAMYANGIMGRILDRAEALISAWRAEAFALSDHIVECDQPVIEFLNRLNERVVH